jgi:hypothetical protein
MPLTMIEKAALIVTALIILAAMVYAFLLGG